MGAEWVVLFAESRAAHRHLMKHLLYSGVENLIVIRINSNKARSELGRRPLHTSDFITVLNTLPTILTGSEE